MLLLLNMTGDECSFVEELYGKYKNKVYTVAVNILKNREDAEDAVCETFMRIIKDVKYFSGRKDRDIERLIIKYSRWTAINHYNKLKHHNSGIVDISGDGDDLSLLPDLDRTPAEQAELTDITDKVRSLVDRLPRIYKDIIILRYFDEVKIKDIADLCGIKVSAVNMRIARAKTMIEQELKREGYIDEV